MFLLFQSIQQKPPIIPAIDPSKRLGPGVRRNVANEILGPEALNQAIAKIDTFEAVVDLLKDGHLRGIKCGFDNEATLSLRVVMAAPTGLLVRAPVETGCEALCLVRTLAHSFPICGRNGRLGGQLLRCWRCLASL